MEEVKLTIPGKPISGTNSKRWVQRGDRRFLVPSAAAERWKKEAYWHVRGQWKTRKPLTELREVELHVYRERNSGDVDNYPKLVLDTLQAAHVFENDRIIKRLIVNALVDRDNPRVEVTIRL